MFYWKKNLERMSEFVLILLLLGASIESPIKSYVLQQEWNRLEEQIGFSSRYIRSMKKGGSLLDIETLPPVYRNLIEGNLQELKNTPMEKLPDDPYFLFSLGRLFLYHQDVLTSSAIEKKQAWALWQKALQSTDPYLHWFLRPWSSKNPYDMSNNPVFLLMDVFSSFTGHSVDENSLKTALNKNIQNPDYLADLGEILWRLGRFEEAKSLWHQAIYLYPGDSMEKRALLYQKMGEMDEVIRIYKDLYHQGGENSYLYLYSLISAYSQKSSLSPAEEIDQVEGYLELKKPFTAIETLEKSHLPNETRQAMMNRAIQLALQKMSDFLVTLGISGKILASSKILNLLTMKALVEKVSSTKPIASLLGYLTGNCEEIPPNESLYAVCQQEGNYREEEAQKWLQNSEESEIVLATEIMQTLLPFIDRKEKAMRVGRLLASVKASSGNFQGALDILNQLAKKKWLDADIQFDRGSYLLQLNQGKEAEEALQDALKRGLPYEPVVARKLHRALYLQGKVRKAISVLEEALSKFPDNPEILTDLLYQAKEHKAYKTAVVALQALIRVNPQHRWHYESQLVTVYWNTGQIEEAVQHLKAYYEASLDDESLWNLAGAHAGEKNMEEILQRCSSFPLFQIYLKARWYQISQQEEKTTGTLENGVNLFPDNLFLLNQLGTEYWRRAEHLKAAEIYHRLALLDPFEAENYREKENLMKQLAMESSA